jgi:hypothetical protein
MRSTTIVGELPFRQKGKAHKSPPKLLSSTGNKRASVDLKWMPTDGSMAAHLTRRRPRQVPSSGQLIRGYATRSASERGWFGHQGCNTGQTVGSHLELFMGEMHQALPPAPTPSHIHWKLFCITAKITGPCRLMDGLKTVPPLKSDAPQSKDIGGHTWEDSSV